MDDKIAIKVNDVSKAFKLPHEKQSSIKGLFINIFRGKRTFERQKVLNNISFEIKKGEFFGIAGRNGSGKSTLLKLIAGIYSPNKGSIEVNGQLTPFIELGVGFNPELTGRENVFLNGALLGFDRKQMELMYDSIVSFAELERFMDQKLKNYSSGMQVRLAFSIAIKADTQILLFDEVLAVGDAKFQKKCLQVFRDLKKAGKTIILVSHSTADMERFCDRILVLDKGEALGIYGAREGSVLYQEINFEDQDGDNSDRPSHQNKRWGNGKVKIDKITVTSDKKSISTGHPIKVTTYLSRENSDTALNIKLGIAFYDSDGINISGPNSFDETIMFSKHESDISIEYTLENNIFNKGNYKLTAAVVSDDESEIYDQRVDLMSFDVISDKEYFGKILMNGRWKKS